jgi:glycosyltransferase involved in cell wall biosynthesis
MPTDRRSLGESLVNVTAIVPARDEEHNVTDCLASLAWADERVVFLDSRTVDRTAELAQEAGARVVRHTFENFSQFHNAALAICRRGLDSGESPTCWGDFGSSSGAPPNKTSASSVEPFETPPPPSGASDSLSDSLLERIEAEWVFFADADERCTPELAEEIREVTGENREEVLWWVPRHNYIFGRLTLGGGWYPDYQPRLLLRGHAHWERPVHEITVSDGPEGKLQNPLIHYNYVDLPDFIARQQGYTDLAAGRLLEEGVQPRFYTPYSQAARHFWWRFVTLNGARDGLHGLRLSILTAYYEAVTYRKLKRLWGMQADL